MGSRVIYHSFTMESTPDRLGHHTDVLFRRYFECVAFLLTSFPSDRGFVFLVGIASIGPALPFCAPLVVATSPVVRGILTAVYNAGYLLEVGI